MAGWLVFKGRSSEVSTESTPKKVLTALPTTNMAPTATSAPTPTPATSSGGMFVTITVPVNMSTVKTATVLVKGMTLPFADVGVNENDVTADGKGNFSVLTQLDSGENEIAVIATNEKGDFAENNIIVNRE